MHTNPGQTQLAAGTQVIGTVGGSVTIGQILMRHLLTLISNEPPEPAGGPALSLQPTLSLSFSKIASSDLCCSLQTFKPFCHFLFYFQLCHVRNWIF